MKNRVKRQIAIARKKGLDPVEVLRMREIARKEAEKMENEATERALLYMLAIPLSILFNDYWPKTAKKKAPKFIEEVIEYYLAVQDGQVSDQELVDTLYNLSGVRVTADWLDRVKEDYECKNT